MKARTLWAVLALILIAGLAWYGHSTYNGSSSAAVSTIDESMVQATVEGFGSQLKMVSLLAPDAAAQIQTQYAAYVAPELLQTWAADPSNAPGRQTSSP